MRNQEHRAKRRALRARRGLSLSEKFIKDLRAWSRIDKLLQESEDMKRRFIREVVEPDNERIEKAEAEIQDFYKGYQWTPEEIELIMKNS